MAFELEGEVHKIFDVEKKSEKFQARDFVVKIANGNYTDYIKFQLTQDRCDLADKHKEGETVKVHFDLKGNEWNGKFFTNLNAWRIETVATGAPVVDQGTGGDDAPFPIAEPSGDNMMAEDFDDLPF